MEIRFKAHPRPRDHTTRVNHTTSALFLVFLVLADRAIYVHANVVAKTRTSATLDGESDAPGDGVGAADTAPMALLQERGTTQSQTGFVPGMALAMIVTSGLLTLADFGVLFAKSKYDGKIFKLKKKLRINMDVIHKEQIKAICDQATAPVMGISTVFDAALKFILKDVEAAEEHYLGKINPTNTLAIFKRLRRVNQLAGKGLQLTTSQMAFERLLSNSCYAQLVFFRRCGAGGKKVETVCAKYMIPVAYRPVQRADQLVDRLHELFVAGAKPGDALHNAAPPPLLWFAKFTGPKVGAQAASTAVASVAIGINLVLIGMQAATLCRNIVALVNTIRTFRVFKYRFLPMVLRFHELDMRHVACKALGEMYVGPDILEGLKESVLETHRGLKCPRKPSSKHRKECNWRFSSVLQFLQEVNKAKETFHKARADFHENCKDFLTADKAKFAKGPIVSLMGSYREPSVIPGVWKRNRRLARRQDTMTLFERDNKDLLRQFCQSGGRGFDVGRFSFEHFQMNVKKKKVEPSADYIFKHYCFEDEAVLRNKGYTMLEEDLNVGRPHKSAHFSCSSMEIEYKNNRQGAFLWYKRMPPDLNLYRPTARLFVKPLVEGGVPVVPITSIAVAMCHRFGAYVYLPIGRSEWFQKKTDSKWRRAKQWRPNACERNDDGSELNVHFLHGGFKFTKVLHGIPAPTLWGWGNIVGSTRFNLNMCADTPFLHVMSRTGGSQGPIVEIGLHRGHPTFKDPYVQYVTTSIRTMRHPTYLTFKRNYHIYYDPESAQPTPSVLRRETEAGTDDSGYGSMSWSLTASSNSAAGAYASDDSSSSSSSSLLLAGSLRKESVQSDQDDVQSRDGNDPEDKGVHGEENAPNHA